AVTEVPGQHADFYSEPLPSTVDVVGAPAVAVRAASPTGEAVLFVKLYDVDEHGQNTLPDGLVAPVRLTGLPPDIADAKPVRVVLPGIVHRLEAGHRLGIMVERNQVVGLLGPNGAGKTTTLRVLMGLIRATAGEVLVYGHPLTPGAPVLSRLGALVEGPGFLPHLSGLANLRTYWRSTGRPA